MVGLWAWGRRRLVEWGGIESQRKKNKKKREIYREEGNEKMKNGVVKGGVTERGGA